jgi:2-keto-4-pentenoate hydratase
VLTRGFSPPVLFKRSHRDGPIMTQNLNRQRVQRASDWLVAQHLTRSPFSDFPERCNPIDIIQAYQVQDRFVAAKARACGKPVGWKIALSNPTMQRFVGLSDSVAGRLHERQVVVAPASTKPAAYGRLLIEFEIAIELGRDLPPKHHTAADASTRLYTRDEVAEAVLAVCPAFELADDRHADYSTLHRHGLQMIADNAWNEGAVLGERRTDWRRLDLAALEGVATLNEQIIGQGFGRDLMGHPLDALAWLANHASKRGLGMKAGEVAILGTLITSKFPKAGDTYHFRLDGFSPLRLNVIE